MPEDSSHAVSTPESRDVSAKVLVVFTVCFVAFVGIALVVLTLLFDSRPAFPPPGPAHEANRASPSLQTMPRQNLEAHRAREAEELQRLEWLDEERGLARIPIDAAMRIVAKRGLPDWRPREDFETESCRLLARAVPRAPQLEQCRRAESRGPEGMRRPGMSGR